MHSQHDLVTLTDLQHLLSDDATCDGLAYVLDHLTAVDTGATLARLVVELDTLLVLIELQVVVAHQQTRGQADGSLTRHHLKHTPASKRCGFIA